MVYRHQDGRTLEVGENEAARRRILERVGWKAEEVKQLAPVEVEEPAEEETEETEETDKKQPVKKAKRASA